MHLCSIHSAYQKKKKKKKREEVALWLHCIVVYWRASLPRDWHVCVFSVWFPPWVLIKDVLALWPPGARHQNTTSATASCSPPPPWPVRKILKSWRRRRHYSQPGCTFDSHSPRLWPLSRTGSSGVNKEQSPAGLFEVRCNRRAKHNHAPETQKPFHIRCFFHRSYSPSAYLQFGVGGCHGTSPVLHRAAHHSVTGNNNNILQMSQPKWRAALFHLRDLASFHLIPISLK